jgi:hypothetical protein
VKKHTSQQAHQVEDQALNDTYSDMHLTHQSQVPGKHATNTQYGDSSRGKKYCTIKCFLMEREKKS